MIGTDYTEWLDSKIRGTLWNPDYYRKLLSHLSFDEYRSDILLDVQNRNKDGYHLWDRYLYETNTKFPRVPNPYDHVTLFEVLLALAIRGEDQFMADSEIGDRTALWFWTMLDNIGFTVLDDNHWSDEIYNEKLYIFLNRKYEANGEGGAAFRIKSTSFDLRNVELWTQMCLYFDEYEGYVI